VRGAAEFCHSLHFLVDSFPQYYLHHVLYISTRLLSAVKVLYYSKVISIVVFQNDYRVRFSREARLILIASGNFVNFVELF